MYSKCAHCNRKKYPSYTYSLEYISSVVFLINCGEVLSLKQDTFNSEKKAINTYVETTEVNKDCFKQNRIYYHLSCKRRGKGMGCWKTDKGTGDILSQDVRNK